MTRTLALALVLATPLTPAAIAPASPLDVPRAAHSATLLSDGRVLVAGGCTRFGCERATERTVLFEPRTGRFAPGPPLLRPRVGHAAVRLRDGNVLVLGGWVGTEPARSAELYNPSRGRFIASGPMTNGRGGLAAVLLPDGRVLVTGGVDGKRTLASAELYDPRRGTFARTGSMRWPRSAHTATLLSGGRVLVVGGSTGSRVLATAELWHPHTGRFTTVGALSSPRHKHAAIVLRDGRVLVVGGSDARDFRGKYRSAELYLPKREGFIRTASMRSARFKLPDAAVRLADGSVLVAGGAAAVERYDVRRRRFVRAGSVGIDLSFSTATVLHDGRVLVVGGYDGNIEPTSKAWLFAAR
jgi:Kelch motif